MQTTIEETDKHVVRLTIEVPPEEFAKDLDHAYGDVAKRVKIPGFRKGKVPKQIIDARIGREHVLHEFVDEFLPKYYLRALRDNDLAPIADPEIDLDTIEDGQPLRFTAVVEVRPRLALEPSQYRGLQVDAPATEPRELEIDEYLDQVRERFAELEAIARPAAKGDYVLADVRASLHGAEIPEASRVGFLTEVGKEELVPELDRELDGKRKGDILKFNATLPESFGEKAGTEVTFQVLVKEVKSKRLPAADDEFAKTASEFDTMEELREDIRAKLRTLKEAEARSLTRDLVLRRIMDGIEIDLPDRLVDEETQLRVERAEERAKAAGMSLEQVLQTQGWDDLRFRSDARSHAIRAIKADLILEGVARAEGIQVSAEDLDREIRDLARATGREPKEVRKILERSGQVTTLAGDIIRAKALDLLVESAEISREEGPASPPDPSSSQEDQDE
jgi:trigger factor